MSYSPLTGLVYIPTLEAGFGYVPADPKTFQQRRGVVWSFGVDPVGAAMPEDEAVRKAIRASSKGRLVAWNPVEQKAMWNVEYPIAWNGGLLTTAGGLLFQGTGQGRFVAYDAKDGKKLWDFHAQTGIVAAPVTYEVDGEQYVTVLAGWGGAIPLLAGELALDAAKGGTNRVLTFKLGAKAELPMMKVMARKLEPPQATAPKDVVDKGRASYQQFCAGCHGDTAASGGVVPDLRYSATLGDGGAWKAIVLEGAMLKNGMVTFEKYLKPEEVDQIRAYVIQRAHDEKKRLATVTK
jgi:mono/diheme cytochrome c family protein